MNNKISIKFGFRGISRIIEALVTPTSDSIFNNSRYPAEPHPIIVKHTPRLYDLIIVHVQHNYLCGFMYAQAVA